MTRIAIVLLAADNSSLVNNDNLDLCLSIGSNCSGDCVDIMALSGDGLDVRRSGDSDGLGPINYSGSDNTVCKSDGLGDWLGFNNNGLVAAISIRNCLGDNSSVEFRESNGLLAAAADRNGDYSRLAGRVDSLMGRPWSSWRRRHRVNSDYPSNHIVTALGHGNSVSVLGNSNRLYGRRGLGDSNRLGRSSRLCHGDRLWATSWARSWTGATLLRSATAFEDAFEAFRQGKMSQGLG